MKNLLILIVWITFSQTSFSQKKEKETIYLMFDVQNKEKCLIEDGSGNSKYINKFRKEYQDEYIFYKICDEVFSTNNTKSFKDTCSIKALNNLKLVEFDYILEKYNSENEFKHHVFEKIYFIEKLSKDKIIKYEVTWIDDIIMIDD